MTTTENTTTAWMDALCPPEIQGQGVALRQELERAFEAIETLLPRIVNFEKQVAVAQAAVSLEIGATLDASSSFVARSSDVHDGVVGLVSMLAGLDGLMESLNAYSNLLAPEFLFGCPVQPERAAS